MFSFFAHRMRILLNSSEENVLASNHFVGVSLFAPNLSRCLSFFLSSGSHSVCLPFFCCAVILTFSISVCLFLLSFWFSASWCLIFLFTCLLSLFIWFSFCLVSQSVYQNYNIYLSIFYLLI